MPVYVLDTSFEIEESGGVAAHRVVVRGSNPTRCALPTAANADNVLGVTVEDAEEYRSVAVRRLGKALVAAAGAIAVGARVCVADNQGRVKAVTRANALTGVVGNNNAIRWRAREHSAAGNTIAVDIVVAGANTALSVAVSGNTITINSATNSESAATTTAAEAIAAVAAHSAAKLLVTGANESTSTGAGVVAGETATLSGGEGTLNIVGIAEESASASGDIIDVLLTP